MADDRSRFDGVNVRRHFRRVRLRRKMGEKLEWIVLACRKRGLASNIEDCFLLANDNFLYAPHMSSSGNWLEILDETIPEMRGGPGVVHPVVPIMRGSGLGRVHTRLLRRGFISKIHAEVERKDAMELEQDGWTIRAIDPPTKISTTDPSIEDRCFVLAWERILMSIFSKFKSKQTYHRDGRLSLSCLIYR